MTMFNTMCPVSSYAAEQNKVVRVGWYESPMFQEGYGEGLTKSGYCYDYLQKVADYTGWQYKYVYGEWPELFRMLQNGEIDFLAGVSATEERKQTMLFADYPMGIDQYYIFKRADNEAINAADVSTLTGKKIGGMVNNRTTYFTQKWLEENHIAHEMVYFKSFEELENAFANGKIDILAQTINNVLKMENVEIVAKVGEEPFYVAVQKNGKGLLKQLNYSVNTMLSVNPYILQNLQYANYGSNLTIKTMTKAEKDWLASKSGLKVGYMDNYLPYATKDEQGNATGVVKDVMGQILTALKIKDKLPVEYEAFTDNKDMVAALKNGKVDVIFPVDGNFWDLEQQKIDGTSNVVNSYGVLFYKGDYSKLKKLAVNKNNLLQIEYCRRIMPQYELIGYDNILECLDGIMKGEVDGTIMDSLRMELVTRNPKYKELTYVPLSQDVTKCFGVHENNNALLLLLNRGLRIIGHNYGMDCSHKYMDGLYKYGAADFLREHIFAVALLTLLILGMIIGVLTYSLRSIKKNSEKVKALNMKLTEAKNQAEAANEAKTTFLNNMSHDIRTPMNAIIGFTALLEKNFANRELSASYLNKIKSSSNYLLDLINNILDLSRVESGKVELEESPWDVGDFDTNIGNFIEAQTKQKQLYFKKSSEVVHKHIYCDSTKLFEIFINILSNAVKYTPEGGSITMKTVELPCEQEGYCCLETSISDTGIGMSEEFLPHIFDEFTREKNTTECKILGTGLGMAITKKYADLMGAKLKVTSELGKGSCFTITITHRICEQEPYEEKAETTAEQSYNFSGKRVLLAEDNELNAEIAMAILEEAGLEVEHAENGQDAVDKIVANPAGYYDLVLMDIQMPVMNGYTAARTIRGLEDAAKANIPIFAMTANAFKEDMELAEKAGMNGHLAKPIDVEKLMAVLSSILQK